MLSARSNAEAIIAKLRLQIERMQDFTLPLQAAGVVVRDAAVLRFKMQGGDQTWAPNKRGGHTGIDTGRLWQSIAVSPPDPKAVTIGTNVRYARWFQEGTGIFAGHSAWTVRAKTAGALAFSVGGETYVRRSVTIPGQPPRPFLVVTEAERSKINEIFQTWILKGVV